MEHIAGIPILSSSFNCNDALEGCDAESDMDFIESHSPGLIRMIAEVSGNTAEAIIERLANWGYLCSPSNEDIIYSEIGAGMFTVFGALMAQANKDAESSNPSD